MVGVDHFVYRYRFPAAVEPRWKAQVERWYQLDAYAYGLTQAYDVWRASGVVDKPEFLFLASPEASNRTDAQFAGSGASSPQKFVHTLPNIRSASLFQVMEWSGPMLCIQKDPHTVATALVEAAEFVGAQAAERVWLMSVVRGRGAEDFEAHLLSLSRSSQAAFRVEKKGHSGLAATPADNYFISWLSSKVSSGNDELELSRHLKIRRALTKG